MTLEIETPSGHAAERNYVLSVVLEEWLGLKWRLAQSDRLDVRITLQEQAGEIRLPDALFSVPEESWLKQASMPGQPLSEWGTGELGGDITLCEPTVPVLYGDNRPQIRREANSITLPLDIFGSAFFMLSRYEEFVTSDRDEHDRFPAWASVAYTEGFLDRPIVDEYVEILWAAMQHLWDGLRRKRHHPRTLVSCDVDSPFALDGRLSQTVLRVGGDLLERRAPGLVVETLLGGLQARSGIHTRDPHRRALDWIMEVNERAERAVAFYFIPENTDPRLDKRVSLDDPRMRTLLRDIHARGHEIGIHPGYNTYRHPEAMRRSVRTLRRVLDEEGIKQSQLGGRQHFLRWQTPTTARLWNDNGLDYDSTLSYADRPGFRCGTCREYPLYDLEQRCPLRLRERPLIVMECSVIAKRHLGLGYSKQALVLMQGYRDTCHRFGGSFTLLWHNSHFGRQEDKRFYQALTGRTAS